jgi:hypothetical protein
MERTEGFMHHRSNNPTIAIAALFTFTAFVHCEYRWYIDFVSQIDCP